MNLELDMPFGKAEIKEAYLRGEEVRLFLVEGTQESATYLHPLIKNELVFPYTKVFASLFSREMGACDVLMLGGGAFSVPKYLISHFPQVRMDVVELYREVYEMALDYFFLDELYEEYHLMENRRLQVFLEEGLHYLKACTKTYDIIYDDAYHGILPDSGLLSYEATVLMKKRLKEGGLLAINMIGALQGSSSMRALLSEEVLKRVFRNVELRQNMEIPPDLPSQNLILLGSDAPLPPTRMLLPNDLSEDWAEH